jgi:hypothetical protein
MHGANFAALFACGTLSRSDSTNLQTPNGFKLDQALPPIDLAPYGVAVAKGNTALADR